MQVEARSDGGDVGIRARVHGIAGHVAVPGVVGREDRTRADRRAAAGSGLRGRTGPSSPGDHRGGPSTTSSSGRGGRRERGSGSANPDPGRDAGTSWPLARAEPSSRAAFRRPHAARRPGREPSGCGCARSPAPWSRSSPSPGVWTGSWAPPLPRARTGAAPAAPRRASPVLGERRLQTRERLDRGRVHALEHGQVDAHEIAQQKQRKHPLETAVPA